MIGSVSSGQNLNVKPVKVSNLNHYKCMTKNKLLSLKKANIRRTCRIMRVFFLFFTLGISFCFSNNSYSQSTKISLNLKNKTVKQVFSEIEKNSEFIFFYQDDIIDVNRRVSVSADNGTIEQILDEVLSATGNTYFVSDRSIYIIKKTSDNIVHEENVVQQRTKTITGTITYKDGEAVIGANIVEKGTTNGTVTDVNGIFSLRVEEDATLHVSYIGYLSQDINTAGKTNFNIILQEDAKILDEVVAIGYGTQKKSDLTGSIVRVNASQYATKSTTNLLEMLNGTVAGFESNQGTSSQGGGSMLVRGQKSLKASNDPLVVLNGVIFHGSIADINPTDIETIDILKDASSAAVYGARSSAGVIIVTTKRGKSGKPSLSFNSELGITSARKTMRVLTAEEYMENRGQYLYQTYGTRPLYYYMNPNNLPDGVTLDDWLNLDQTISDDPMDMWLNRLNFTTIEKKNYLAGNTIDWFDEVFRDGIRQDYNVSLSGGAENFQYYVSGGYTGNQGITQGDDYSVFRAKTNLDVQATSFLKFSADINYSHKKIDSQSANLEQTIRSSPYGDLYGEDGNLTFYPSDDIAAENPLVYTKNRIIYNPSDNLFATFSAELSLPWGIKYKPSFVSRMMWHRSYLFDPVTTPRGYNTNGFGQRLNTTNRDWMIDNLFTWQKSFVEKHNLDLTFLYNIEKNQYWYDFQSNSNFSPNDKLSWHALQSGTNPSINNDDQVNTGMALMGRINYSYLSKYLLTLTLRRDGFSAFGQDNPWALFPSAALAWRISEEKFFNVENVDYLKLRLSWGKNGNRSIGAYEALSKLNTEKYIYGTTLVTGVYSSKMSNRNLKWETTESLNAGFDLNMFNNKLSVTLDAYLSSTTDLLIDRTLPSIIGYTSVSANLGEIQNKGIEVTINTTNIDKPNFKWNSSLVYSYNKNKIVRLYGDMENILDSEGNVIGQKEADDVTNQWFIGQSIDRIWDYEILGIWQADEAEEAKKYGKSPGDIKLKDQNGDGVLTPDDDKIFQGYRRPQHRLGLQNDIRFLKDFELSFFIRADLDVYKNNPLYTSPGGIERRNILYAPYWTADNPSNEYPRVQGNFGSPGFGVWKNASFVRIQDISFAYNVPKTATDFLKIQQLKAYVNLRNFVTITKWKNWDPESGSTPMPKYVTFGLNVNF